MPPGRSAKAWEAANRLGANLPKPRPGFNICYVCWEEFKPFGAPGGRHDLCGKAECNREHARRKAAERN